MGMETGLSIPLLRVDGGGSANKFTMQFQSDILGIPIQVSAIAETTALGAGYLAGLASGFWKDTSDISRKWRSSISYEPTMSNDRREELYAEWKRAVERAKDWIKG
jgi:glycerol kinase